MRLDRVLDLLARQRTALVAALALAWCVFALLHLALELFLEQLHLGLWPSILLEAAVAGTIGTLLLAAVTGIVWYRHQVVRRELLLIAELNHQVRNALEIIAASTSRIADKQTVVAILDGVRRIDHTLRDLVPTTAVPRAKPTSRRP